MCGFFLQCLLLYIVGVKESFHEKQFSVQSAVRFRYVLLLALIPDIAQKMPNHMGLPNWALYGALIFETQFIKCPISCRILYVHRGV